MRGILPQAEPNALEVLQTARLVFAQAINPDVPLTVAGLALASGLTEDAVVEALNSPQYLDAMTREFRTMAGLMLRRGLSKMQELVESGTPRDKVPAFRALLETYKVFATVADPNDSLANQQAFRQQLETLKALRAKPIEVTHASSRRAPDRPDPAQAESD